MRWPVFRTLFVPVFLATFQLIAATPHELYQQRDQLEETFRTRCLDITEQPSGGDEPNEHRRKLDQSRRFPHQNLLFLAGPRFLDDGEEQDELRQISHDHARDLAALATSALEAGQPALAYQLLHEVAYFDAAEPRGRAILGLKTATERASEPVARRATRRHPQLAWGRHQYWQVTTDHYQIVTNQDAQAGIELARQLEDLHTVWRQLFFDCWSSRGSLQSAWKRKRRLQPQIRNRHRVVLFASRDEYAQYLRPRQPRIDITLGFYDVGSMTSYFFSGPEASPSTQLHEATHQLFQELQKSLPRVAPEENFWVIEGIALYMESLRRQGPCARVGGFYSDRLQYARYRYLEEEFYVPLEELVSLGRDALQQDPRIRRLYSQAAGLTHFLMDDDVGRHRPGLMEYLRGVYQGSARRDELVRTTNRPFSTLDRQYRDFLNLSDRNLQETLLTEDSIQSLCLGRTAVTDQGLAALSSQKMLQWVDLAYTPVSDQGLEFIRGAGGLRQVNLEGTAITDRSLAMLAQCPQIEELDVSHTAVTDTGIQHIAALPHLRVLWLAGTRITDRSVDLLSASKTLEQIDVSATRITDRGRKELQQRLPNATLH